MSTHTRYRVTGMTCEHCVATVTGALSALPGVDRVAVDLPTGQVDLHSRQPLDHAAVSQAITSSGYELADAV